MTTLYKISLYFLAFTIVALTGFFKYKTGSFLKISDEAKREVVAYEMKKRKNDLSTFSLTKSSIDINKLSIQIKNELSTSTNLCVVDFLNKNKNLASDSFVLVCFKEVMSTGNYNESKNFNNSRHTWIYQEPKAFCSDSALIIFKKIENEYAIDSLLYLDKFIACSCL